MKCVFKCIRKGAYECGSFLVLQSPWLNEHWDGEEEKFLRWKVYRSGSMIEKRVLLDSFRTRREACAFVERQQKQ